MVSMSNSASSSSRGAVQGEEAALADLVPHGIVDHVVGMAEDDGSDSVHPVDVLVAVHVDEPRPLGVIGVYRTDRMREAAGPPADELRLAGDKLLGAVIEIEGCLYPALRRGHVGPFMRSYSVASPLNAQTIVESLERFDNPRNRVIDFSQSLSRITMPTLEL